MPKKIKIGPYHPLLLEPEAYEVTVENDKIIDVNIEQGYTHRGIEKLMQKKTFHQGVYLSERICGLCSQAHSTAYCTAVEGLFNIEIPEKAGYIRALLAEFDRLQSHYFWLAVLLNHLKEDAGFLKTLDAREKIMDLLEQIVGNRIHYSSNVLGGVKSDLDLDGSEKVTSLLEDLSSLTDELLALLNKHEEELSGIGVLTKDEATSLGAVGPVLRASGVKSDIRTDDPYAAYGEFEFEVPIEESGDVLARALIRARETRESIGIVNQILGNMPSTELKVNTGMSPETESLGRVEAPRGELMYFVKSNSTNIPERVKIRTPTFMNDRTLDAMLLDQELDDLPLVLESIDRCISCTNRVTVIDAKTGKSRVIKLSELE